MELHPKHMAAAPEMGARSEADLPASNQTAVQGEVRGQGEGFTYRKLIWILAPSLTFSFKRTFEIQLWHLGIIWKDETRAFQNCPGIIDINQLSVRNGYGTLENILWGSSQWWLILIQHLNFKYKEKKSRAVSCSSIVIRNDVENRLSVAITVRLKEKVLRRCMTLYRYNSPTSDSSSGR